MTRRLYQFAPIFLFAVLLGTSAAQAQTKLVSLEIKKNDTALEVQIPGGAKPSDVLEFYYLSRGNISSTLGVQVNAPTGTSYQVDYTLLTGAIPKALENTKIWWKVDGLGEKSKTKRAGMQVPGVNIGSSLDGLGGLFGFGGGLPAGKCGGVPAAVLTQFKSVFQTFTGKTITDAQACLVVTGKNGGENGSIFGSQGDKGNIADLLSGSGRAILYKDSCAPKTSRYLVRVTVALKKVDAAALASGFSTSVTVTENVKSGGMEASIKPTSEGRFAPQPLILMRATGYGEEYIVHRWSKKGPSLVGTVKVEDYVYYSGLVLARGVASKILRGGRGTIQLTNGSTVAAACMPLVRARSKANGYPG